MGHPIIYKKASKHDNHNPYYTDWRKDYKVEPLSGAASGVFSMASVEIFRYL